VDHPLCRRISAVLDLDRGARAIEYEDRWYTWGQLGAASRHIADTVAPGVQVGILLHNTPAHVAALLGVLLAGGCVVVVNPSRGDDRLKSDFAALDLSMIIGNAADLEQLVESTAMRVTIADLNTPPEIPAGEPPSAAPTKVAVRMLTSGTTGPPKRVDLTYDMLAVSVMGAAGAHRRGVPRVAVCRRGAAVRTVASFRTRDVGGRGSPPPPNSVAA
jgi:long-chain acyl-CoA synthetase